MGNRRSIHPMGPLSDGKDAVGASCASTLPWRLPRCRRGGGSRPEGGVENFMARHAAARAARGTVGLDGGSASHHRALATDSVRARCRSLQQRRPALRRGACGCSPAEAGRHVHLEIGLSLRRDFSRSGRRLGRGRLELRLPRPCVVGRNKGRLWRGVEGGGESRSSRACSFASWPWRESTSRLKSAAAAQRRPASRFASATWEARDRAEGMDGATLRSSTPQSLSGGPKPRHPPPTPSSPAITPLSLAPPPPPFPVSLITPALGALRHERRPHRHRRAKSPRHASVARHVRSPQHAKLSGARLSLRVPSIALLHRGLPTRPRPTRRPGANAGRRRLCRERHWNRREEAPLAAC